MKYWDSSALIPLLVAEEATEVMQALLRQDRQIVTWWGTAVECYSALCRRQRENRNKDRLNVADFAKLEERFELLSQSLNVIKPTAQLRARSLRLLAVHTLRAADALQLASALVWCEEQTKGAAFVCLDDRLNVAAAKEGFTIGTQSTAF